MIPRPTSGRRLRAGTVIALVALVLAVASLAMNGFVIRSFRPAATDGVSNASDSRGGLRWSALESGDPAVYAANLRAAGCPEEVIAAVLAVRRSPEAGHASAEVAIVSGSTRPEATTEYRAEGGAAAPELVTMMTTTGAGSAGVEVDAANAPVIPSAPTSGAPSSSRRSGTVRATVGVPSPRTATDAPGGSFPALAATSSPAANANDVVITAPQGDVNIPAAFADPATAELDPAQRQQITRLQDQFLNAIGGTGQDPADPAYRQAWQTAQWKSDQLFRALFGHQAWLDRQFQANQHAAE